MNKRITKEHMDLKIEVIEHRDRQMNAHRMHSSCPSNAPGHFVRRHSGSQFGYLVHLAFQQAIKDIGESNWSSPRAKYHIRPSNAIN